MEMGSSVLGSVRGRIVLLNDMGNQLRLLLTIDDCENREAIVEFVAEAINEKMQRDFNFKHSSSTMDETKVKYKVSTSEELFGITCPPVHQCPIINGIIEDFKSVSNGGLTPEKVESIVASIEKLRKDCEGIRFWGTQWKNLSKKLIGQRDKSWSGYADLIDKSLVVS